MQICIKYVCICIFVGVRGFHSRVIFSWVRWSTGLGLFEIFVVVVVVVVFQPEITKSQNKCNDSPLELIFRELRIVRIDPSRHSIIDAEQIIQPSFI